MPRAPRIEFENATYHVMARGNRREAIVRTDEDREIFVDTLFAAVLRCRWQVYAWVLMDNHYHLCLRTPEANLVEGMKWLQNTYTRRFNSRHRLWGHLFGGRYKSVLVQGEDNLHTQSRADYGEYLTSLVDYIHLNPARAGIVDGGERPLASHRWNSLSCGYQLPPSKRPEGMAVEYGLSLFELRDNAQGRRRFLERLENRVAQERRQDCGLPPEIEGQSWHQSLERGWCWGSALWREEVIEEHREQIESKTSRNFQGSPVARESRLTREKAILVEAELHFERGVAELAQKNRGDQSQVAVAWALARRSTSEMSRIAELLGLSSAANASNRIRSFEKTANKNLPERIRAWKRKYEI